MSIRKLPSILTLHVKRFEHRNLHGLGRKLETPLAFPVLRLNMWPFLSACILRRRFQARIPCSPLSGMPCTQVTSSCARPTRAPPACWPHHAANDYSRHASAFTFLKSEMCHPHDFCASLALRQPLEGFREPQMFLAGGASLTFL